MGVATDEDIAALFSYVKTFKRVRHHVNNSEPPTYCKLWRHVPVTRTKTERIAHEGWIKHSLEDGS